MIHATYGLHYSPSLEYLYRWYLGLNISFGWHRVREVGHPGQHLLLDGRGAELAVDSLHLRLVGGGVHGLCRHFVLSFGLRCIRRWLIRMLKLCELYVKIW